MGFLSERWDVTADRVWFEGKDLLSLSAAERRDIIGVDIAMIFSGCQELSRPEFNHRRATQ